MLNVDFLKNEFRKQYASKLQRNRLNFPVLLVVSTLKTVNWGFLLSENGFVIFTLLKSRGPPWSPVVLLVQSRCPPLFVVVCCVICAIPLSPVVPCRPCFPMVLRVSCLCLPLLLYLVFF